MKNSSRYTAPDTQIDTMTYWINVEREVTHRTGLLLCCPRRSCLVRTIDWVANERWFSSDQAIIWTCLCVCTYKLVSRIACQLAALKWKGSISGFLICKTVRKYQLGEDWGKEFKRILITYYVTNPCSKNCQKSIHVCRSYSQQKWCILRHHVHYLVSRETWKLRYRDTDISGFMHVGRQSHHLYGRLIDLNQFDWLKD